MIDRVKVIKGLEEAVRVIENHVPERYRGYSRLSCYDAIALLREQVVEQTEIVRCRNCRHYNTECCTDGFGWCEHRDFGTNDEWYCADGEVN